MKTISLVAILLCFPMVFTAAESLWDEEFSSYGTGTRQLLPGQILTVTINTDTKLSFSSTSSGERELVLTFSGGETGNLFSFLPEAASSRRGNTDGEEDIALSASIAVRVQETDDSGMSFLQGSRNTSLSGGVQALTVSGWCNPKSVAADGTIPFQQLADGTLTYRTLLDGDGEILREEDIITAIAALESEAVDDTEEEGGTGTPLQPTVSEERKDELLLQYINQFLNMIFSNKR